MSTAFQISILLCNLLGAAGNPHEEDKDKAQGNAYGWQDLLEESSCLGFLTYPSRTALQVDKTKD